MPSRGQFSPGMEGQKCPAPDHYSYSNKRCAELFLQLPIWTDLPLQQLLFVCVCLAVIDQHVIQLSLLSVLHGKPALVKLCPAIHSAVC